MLAKIEVLCLGEGECISIDRNAVHPGSLSGASYQEKLEYFNWLKNQAAPYGIIPPVLDFSESDSLSESDSDQLDALLEDIDHDVAKPISQSTTEFINDELEWRDPEEESETPIDDLNEK